MACSRPGLFIAPCMKKFFFGGIFLFFSSFPFECNKGKNKKMLCKDIQSIVDEYLAPLRCPFKMELAVIRHQLQRVRDGSRSFSDGESWIRWALALPKPSRKMFHARSVQMEARERQMRDWVRVRFDPHLPPKSNAYGHWLRSWRRCSYNDFYI